VAVRDATGHGHSLTQPARCDARLVDGSRITSPRAPDMPQQRLHLQPYHGSQMACTHRGSMAWHRLFLL
jgi:hypothetical protein